MTLDVYETAWRIMETLHRLGPLNANQIQANTKKINRITMYKAFPLLKKDGLIQRDKNKIYALNTAKFMQESQYMEMYRGYRRLSDTTAKSYKGMEKLFENYKGGLEDNESNVKFMREALTKGSWLRVINDMVRLFQLGSLMEFFINVGIFPKTTEGAAIALRRKNEKVFSEFLAILLKHEPLMWRETIMLVQTRLASKIDYS